MSPRRTRKRGSRTSSRRRRSRRGSSPFSGIDVRRLGIGAGLALAGLVLGYLFTTLFVFPAPGPPRDLQAVPDLRDRPLELALETLADAGFSFSGARGIQHPQVDSGQVMGQAPLPGQLARPGDTITLTISLGPERRAVPEVARLRSDRAVDLLIATGFQVVVDSVESPVARGRIIGIEPAEGTELTLPGSVSLEVSLGPPTVRMPLLLGMLEEEARDTLTVLGLEVAEVEQVFRFGRDQGRVVSQDPPEETELERGSEVRLQVGRRGGEPQEH